MPDEERIELMIRVKEGKISMHDAVERVRGSISIPLLEHIHGLSLKRITATIASVHPKCLILFFLNVYLQCKLFGEQIILKSIFPYSRVNLMEPS